MSLTQNDRRFLRAVDRFKGYVLLTGMAVFLVLLVTPSTEFHAVTSVMGIALCGIFWLTQRLLSLVSMLDLELTRLARAIERSSAPMSSEPS
ncbi:MAG: hypothetical protein Q8R91_00800 [Candidatus Omnitrophota bacterium]|nr:hypothetical protein [Candidatus Omnitrophota bacterium]